MTMFVLSPSVEATNASASAMPACSRTDVSIPWPRWNSPDHWGPRRPSASSLSSMTTTSQPSEWSRAATAEPTLPTPTIRAFTGGSLFLQHALRIRDDHDLARRPAEHVVDRRAEEAGLPAPSRRGSQQDEVDAVALGLLDDRLADRAAADDRALDLHSVLGGEKLRLGERGLGPLLLVRHLGVDGELERHRDHMQGPHGATTLLRQADRGGEHLFADLAELHGHEDPLVDALLLGHEVGNRRLDVLHQRLVARAAHGDEEDGADDEPDGAGDPRRSVGVERRDPEREGERSADERGQRDLDAAQAHVSGHAVRAGQVGLGEAQADDGELRRGECNQRAEAVQAR